MSIRVIERKTIEKKTRSSKYVKTIKCIIFRKKKSYNYYDFHKDLVMLTICSKITVLGQHLRLSRKS